MVGEGRILPGSRVDLVRSGIAVAVRAGAPRPDIGSEDAVRRAVLARRASVTRPDRAAPTSRRLFERWGIADAVAAASCRRRPACRSARSWREGEVELGFQQLAELMHLPGIAVLGPLPAAIQLVTTFSGGVAATSTRPDDARALLAPGVAGSGGGQARHGMEPA